MRLSAWLTALAVPLVGCEDVIGDEARAADPADAGRAEDTALMDVIRDWNVFSRWAAIRMVNEYGPPDEVDDTHLVWNDNGPFLATVVYAEGVRHDFPVPHLDVLEQTVRYDVPLDLYDDLAMYDGSVFAERTKGTLSARGSMQAANFLALNLADQIATGDLGWQQARDRYTDAIADFLDSGELGPLMEGLRFEPPLRSGDPDESTLDRPDVVVRD